MSRLLVATLSCLAIGNACSSDAAAPAAPITFGIEVTLLDGHGVDQAVGIRCDHGGPGAGAARDAFSTLAVTVALTPPPEATRKFVLSPANACGTSTRCGFVRFQALNAAGDVLAQTDSVTTEGVLKVGAEQLPALSQIRVSLIRGVDLQPLQNPDQAAVESIVKPSFIVPSDCVALPPTGVGGAGGETSTGAAGGETSAGGDTSSPTLGGAGGDTSMPALGGAAADSAGGIGGA